MKIVSPQDWRVFQGDIVTVVFEAESPFPGQLLTMAEWHAVVTEGAAVPERGRTPPTPLDPGVWACRLEVPQGWFGRVVAVFTHEQNRVAGALGVMLGRSATAPVRRASPRSQAVRWPLAMGVAALSTMDILPGEKVSVEVVEVARDRLLASPALGPRQACVFEEPQTLEVGAALRRDLCTGAELAGFAQLEQFMSWTSPKLYFLRLADALVDLENGVVMDAHDHVWADSAVATLASESSLRRTTGWFQAGGRLGLAPDVAPVRLEPSRPVAVFCHWATLVNHAHWVMNSLVSVFHLLPELQARELDLLCPPLSSEQRAQLVWMGVPREALVELSERFVVAPDLVFASPLSTAANMHPPPSTRAFLQHLRNTRPRSLTDTPKRLLFTRKGFASTRRISNEDDVEAVLAGLGFVAVAPHELSLAEEIDLVENAEIIVAQLGAALTNIAFATPPTRVVELTSSNYLSNEYCKVASLLGLEYVRLMTNPAEGSAINGPFEFAVDLDALRRAVTEP